MTHRPRPPVALPWPPTVPEIDAAPELAILAAIVALLDIASNALLVANPQLADDDERPYWKPLPPDVPPAGRILQCAASLRRAVHRYRLAVTPPPAADKPAAGDDRIPF